MRRNTGLPQNAPWVPASDLVTPYQVIQNPREENLGGLAMAGVAAGAVALAGGGYYLVKKHLTTMAADASGLVPNADCTKLDVTHAELALGAIQAFVDEAMEGLGAVTSGTTLILAASYLEVATPTCGIRVTEQGIEGADTWQKVAMVGTLAEVILSKLFIRGHLDEADAEVEGAAIQTYLLEHGVNDPEVADQVFNLPSEEGTRVPNGPVRSWPSGTFPTKMRSRGRAANLGALAWAGIGLGIAAVAGGGGYYLMQKRQASQAAEASQLVPDGDCTKLTVSNAELAGAALKAFTDQAMVALGDAPVSTLILGASYLESAVPTCGIAVTDQGIQGLDTWQKAAMVAGMAILIAGRLHEEGLIEAEMFTAEAEAIQAFLLAHGVNDAAMIEDVFEMPSAGDGDGDGDGDGEGDGGGSGGGGGPALTRLQNTPAQSSYGLASLREPNLGGLAWAGIGLGAVALAGGGYYLLQKRLAAQTGVTVDEGCTKFTVLDSAISDAHLRAYVDKVIAAEDRGAATVPLAGASGYLSKVAPQCEDSPNWERAAIVGGLALVVAGRFHQEGAATDAQFKLQQEAIQGYLLEHGVDDPTMIEGVFDMPPEDAGSGDDGSGRAQNPRQANLGLVGWGLLATGAAAVAGGGYLWNRNRKLTEACLGDREWLAEDGSLTPAADAELDAALRTAIADGNVTTLDASDAALVAMAGNADCELPAMMWGDLSRVRAHAMTKAAVMLSAAGADAIIDAGTTGLEFNANCDQVIRHDEVLAESFFDNWLAEQGVAPGMTWVPNPLNMGAEFLHLVAPGCGVSVSAEGSPAIVGVDTPQKAAMVGSFAMAVIFTLVMEMEVITEEQGTAMSAEVAEWIEAHGITDWQAMADEVFVDAPSTGTFDPPGEGGGAPGMGIHPVPDDDWGEPGANELVANGSVGGENAGLWRVYKDNVGEYQHAYYFKIWKGGAYVEDGTYQTIEEAKTAAIARMKTKTAGLAPNPRRRRSARRARPPKRGERVPAPPSFRCAKGYHGNCYCKRWSHPSSVSRICLEFGGCECTAPPKRNPSSPTGRRT